jgi:hypothetical protein
MLTICTRLLNSHICPYKALFTKLCNNGRGSLEMLYRRYKKGLDWLKKSEIRKKCEKCKRAENPNTVPWLLIDWLYFTSLSRIFHLYGDVTIAGEGLQNLSLCLALRAFEQGGVFIVSHLLWHRTSVFAVSSERPPQSVASYDMHGDAESLF